MKLKNVKPGVLFSWGDYKCVMVKDEGTKGLVVLDCGHVLWLEDRGFGETLKPEFLEEGVEIVKEG